MSVFGWSYPPGCSGPPDDERSASRLVEDVLSRLESAEVPEPLCDQIVKLIEDWEIEKAIEFAAVESQTPAPDEDRNECVYCGSLNTNQFGDKWICPPCAEDAR